MSKISIIVRTKNEERWIGPCLKAIHNQDYKNFEVILVDNDSTDGTVEVAHRYKIDKFMTIKQFKPGLALNMGIRASSGKYLVCLSAHCIPQKSDWLMRLKETIEEDKMYAGVYGRQLPLSFTDPIDKRDLLIVFGQDKRIQINDYFFHNANSMIRREIWEKFPFDEEVTNIEDRVWGKAITEAGYKIAYTPDAAVYHYHGLHQGNSPKRAKGVVSIIEKVDRDIFNELPEVMKPAALKIFAILPVREDISNDNKKKELLSKTVNQLRKSNYLSNIFIVSSSKEDAGSYGVHWINRNEINDESKLSLDDFLKNCLSILESRKKYPDFILYVNYDYLYRQEGIFDELIWDAQYKGFDSMFPSVVDFGHYWVQNENGDYIQTDSSMKSRSDRDPQYKAVYGLGCLTATWLIRSGKIVGGKIGILKLTDIKNSFRLKDMESVIQEIS